MKNYLVFLFFLILRIFSVFFVITWYVPDEYWQSLEVGHKLAFGYGHLTWEWSKGIRSYLHPVIISGIYKLLQVLNLDNAEYLTIGPRLAQALLIAYSDYRFYKWSQNKWSIFIISISWFWFYAGTRTLSNSIETALTTIALSYFPWYTESTEFLWFVAIACFMRPTAFVTWLPLCFHHIKYSSFSLPEIIFKRYLPIGFIVGSFSVAVDCFAHGTFILTAFEFLKFNVYENIGEFYGDHPWYWYFAIGLPAILGIFIIQFLWATYDTIKNYAVYPERQTLYFSIIFTLIVYSVLPHKEFRFIMPILPMCLFIVSDVLSRWSRKANTLNVWFIAFVLLISNVLPIVYFSIIHQRGPTDVMPILRNIAREYKDEDNKPAKFMFLMPCHSTPFYSHLHENVTMRFLTCEPNFNNEPNYIDEADEFYNNPQKYVDSHFPVYPRSSLPSHLIVYDEVINKIDEFLQNYDLKTTLHHAFLVSGRIGKSLLVYERKQNFGKHIPNESLSEDEVDEMESVS